MRGGRGWIAGALLAAGMVGMAACGAATAGGPGGVAPRAEAVPLDVNNRGFFDVVIYAVRSPGGAAIRLATVTGHSTARLLVARNALQPGGRLMVRLHAIGSTADWESPELTVDTDLVAKLEIQCNANGNLERSSLYALPASLEKPAARQ